MSFFKFFKSLLFTPIAFTDTYFEKGLMKPQHEKNLNHVLYDIPLSIVAFFLSCDVIIRLFIKPSFSSFIESVFIVIFILIILYGVLWIGYEIDAWVFRKAVKWADGSLSKQQSKDLYLYIAGFIVLFNALFSTFELCGTLYSIFLSLMKFLSGSISYYELEGLCASSSKNFFSLKSLIPLAISSYIQYKILEKTTNTINGVAVIIFQRIIGILIGLAFLLLLTPILLKYGAHRQEYNTVNDAFSTFNRFT